MKKKKNLGLKIMLIFLIVIMLFSLFKIILWVKDNYNTSKQIEKINSLVNIDEVTGIKNTELYCTDKCPEIKLLDVDFTDLEKTNEEVSGWIEVPNTNINYPFVQHKDNKYYLTHSFDKKYSDAGWLFLDYRNSKDFFDTNTIIYAHGRVDGSMFGTLKNVFNDEWLKNKDNHVVKISTKKYNLLYQVFSVYHIKTTDDYIKTGFKSDSDYEEFLKMLKDRSLYNFDYNVTSSDRILTLSTCYNNWEKVVLHAKLIARQFK